MAPRNDNNAENACKKCSKEVKICVTCYSCESKYHPSCILKINGIYVDSGKVLCCDDITSKLIEYRKMEQELQKAKSRLVSLNQLCFEQSMSQTNMIEDGSIAIQEDCNEDMPKKIEIESTDTITTGENKEYEIMYLNRIIEEKADMNEELRDKIKVLNKYISLLEKLDKNETSLVPSPGETSNPTDNCNHKFKKSNMPSDAPTSADNEISMKKTASTPLSTAVITTYADKTKTMKKSVLTPISTAVTTPRRTDDGNKWTIPEKKRKIKQGTDEGAYSLKAADRMAWLYVGRVSKNCTEEDLLEFLRKKQPHRKFEVQKISKPESPNTSFKVGFDFELIEDLNKETFWPRGIIIKRYRFFREQGQFKEARRSPSQFAQC